MLWFFLLATKPNAHASQIKDSRQDAVMLIPLLSTDAKETTENKGSLLLLSLVIAKGKDTLQVLFSKFLLSESTELLLIFFLTVCWTH